MQSLEAGMVLDDTVPLDFSFHLVDSIDYHNMILNHVDPDMLEVGNGGMTTEEYRSHFSIWALAKVFNCNHILIALPEKY